MKSLEGKLVVVIGGAGLIGKQLCIKIAEEGGAIAVADTSVERANDVERDVHATIDGAQTLTAKVNVDDPNSLDELIAEVTAHFGHIDAVVNCSYPRNQNYGRKFESVEISDFYENVNMQLGGAFLTCQRFSRYFLTVGAGNVVNIASVYGFVAPRFEIYDGTSMTMPVEYAAVKAGVIQLTRYLAKYYKGSGIRFNCLSPGGIIDNQARSFLEAYSGYASSKGMLEPEDICGALVFLLSDASRYVNGQNIVVDDGWSL